MGEKKSDLYRVKQRGKRWREEMEGKERGGRVHQPQTKTNKIGKNQRNILNTFKTGRKGVGGERVEREEILNQKKQSDPLQACLRIKKN